MGPVLQFSVVVNAVNEEEGDEGDEVSCNETLDDLRRVAGDSLKVIYANISLGLRQ